MNTLYCCAGLRTLSTALLTLASLDAPELVHAHASFPAHAHVQSAAHSRFIYTRVLAFVGRATDSTNGYDPGVRGGRE